jgi:hypothetical protein
MSKQRLAVYPRVEGYSAVRLLNSRHFVGTVNRVRRDSLHRFNHEFPRVTSYEGATFNRDGEELVVRGVKQDIVSVAGVKLPLAGLDHNRVVTELRGGFEGLLAQQGVALGIFAWADASGDTWASIDLNAIVRQEYRANTLAFAKANDQSSFWDALRGELVEVGGSGDYRLKDLDAVADAVWRVRSGLPVEFSAVKQPPVEAV